MGLIRNLTAAAVVLSSFAQAWLPEGKIRGVNVGNMFVMEPWMDWAEWSKMGCAGEKSEFDCVRKLGRHGADHAFHEHWNSYINGDDLDLMKEYGLNTIRIPLGYWLKEDLVDSSEHFPKGGLSYLTKFCDLASTKGFYIILDLHGGPGAQQPEQPFTGQYAPSAEFYKDYNYDRAIEWLKWMVKIVHTHHEYRGVGMIELVNEPTQGNAAQSLRETYYVNAVKAIRNVERNRDFTNKKPLHIQMMSSLWGSGNPTEFLHDTRNLAFDNHRYLKWSPSIEVSRKAYLQNSCSQPRAAQGPLIVGEWSLSVPDNVADTHEWNPDTQKQFYRDWFAAQVQGYEKGLGWVFWSWKTHLSDYRWSYKAAVEAGVIPRNPTKALHASVC